VVNWRNTITLNHLYEVVSISAQITDRSSQASVVNDNSARRIFIQDGGVNIYCSDSNTPPVSISDMSLSLEDINVFGIRDIFTPVRYFLVSQESGESTNIIVTGMVLKDLGEIS